MAELGCARTETDHERNLADGIATNKRPRSSPTLSTPRRQEKRAAIIIELKHIIELKLMIYNYNYNYN